MAKAAGLPVEALVARGRDAAPEATVATLRALTARRVKREPMAYILGEREFWGLTFRVTPDVLVPRPDSETVIEAALALLPDRTRAWSILDLGIGSGCLLLSLLNEFPNARGVGMDASHAALAVAEGNARALALAARARFEIGDWHRPEWQERLGGPFDLVVSNPPYIEAAAIDELMPEVARFEPRQALDGGPDGLAAYRLIATAARRLVAPSGYLLVEAGERQATDIADIFRLNGLNPEAFFKDLRGIDRVVPGKH